MHNLKELYNNKEILITGGGGFIGSNLAIKLEKLGAKISIMDSRLDSYGYNEYNLKPIKGACFFDFSDIRDKNAVERNIRGKDIIFNLAAQVGEESSQKNPELDYEINILGHQNVIHACIKNNKKARLVFPGSKTQYGKTGNSSISENHKMNPVTPYAINKKLGENMYQDAYKTHGLETVMFRIANPFGPRAAINNPGYCIVNWFVGKAINCDPLPIYGEGLQIRDYIFIDDLIHAMAIAGVSENSKGQIYNLGSGVGTPFKDMAQSIINIADNGRSELNFINWPTDAKNRETGNFTANISKIQKDLGWIPTWSLEDGLKKTIDYYRENIEEYL